MAAAVLYPRLLLTSHVSGSWCPGVCAKGPSAESQSTTSNDAGQIAGIMHTFAISQIVIAHEDEHLKKDVEEQQRKDELDLVQIDIHNEQMRNSSVLVGYNSSPTKNRLYSSHSSHSSLVLLPLPLGPHKPGTLSTP